MSEFILSCCSTADLTEKHFNSRGINYVCFHFMVDEKNIKMILVSRFHMTIFIKQ